MLTAATTLHLLYASRSVLLQMILGKVGLALRSIWSGVQCRTEVADFARLTTTAGTCSRVVGWCRRRPTE